MTREQMEALTTNAPTISGKIRALHDVGVPKADIARFLERRYQHVRNVVRDYEQRKSARGNAVNADTLSTDEPEVYQLRLEAGGSVTLPAAWLESQGLTAGAVILCRFDGDELRVMSRQSAIHALQEIALRKMPQEVAMLEALLGSSIRTI